MSGPAASPGRLDRIAEQLARITSENARLLEKVSESERRFRRVSRGVLRLQEEERGRISRDLHDGIGQLLTALKIQLELLEQEAASITELTSRIAGARELADTALAEVRQLSHLLRPQMLDELGLEPTLRWLARTFQKRTGIAVDLTIEGTERRGDADVETLVYRIVQEALTNVARHSGAKAAAVSLRRERDRLFVRIEDRGSGFSPETLLSAGEDDRGFGVRAMRDRVEFMNGCFSIRSVAGEGTAVEAELPVRDAAPGNA
ncbi:MAG TPA: sensor histidine kinase [Thermoanaerobaculia bacterium]|jgi:two-component system sensor histidine kinase UhpB|nr:sensor histidine kinase [Thermoanaerobaculia bacterium]